MNNPNLLGQLNAPIVVGSGDLLGGMVKNPLPSLLRNPITPIRAINPPLVSGKPDPLKEAGDFELFYVVMGYALGVANNLRDFFVRHRLSILEECIKYATRRVINGMLRRLLLRLCFQRANLRLKVSMRLLKVRMSLCQTRIICLKRGYLSPDEGNLASCFRYGSAAINHPVEVIKVLLECWHRHACVLPPNEKS
jgi:hypothetical protein